MVRSFLALTYFLFWARCYSPEWSSGYGVSQNRICWGNSKYTSLSLIASLGNAPAYFYFPFCAYLDILPRSRLLKSKPIF